MVRIVYIITTLIGIAIGAGLSTLLSLLCNILPDKVYVWYSAIWHWMCLPGNFIRSLFNPEILYKAVEYTTAYNVLWWIGAVVLCWSWGTGILRAFFGKLPEIPQEQ